MKINIDIVFLIMYTNNVMNNIIIFLKGCASIIYGAQKRGDVNECCHSRW